MINVILIGVLADNLMIIYLNDRYGYNVKIRNKILLKGVV